ncbi:GDP-mannose 4,6-dehydratase [Candidatus Uhrbacteria bacterium RIFCSPLOWO2_02_FULL_49_11]|uniref:GDP-mannose 4,6-dehydratase n=1 Tax=Candidatus Uhrbacteria bacterium RIFCSPLOWO2_02_FULL_49_11 TaxID=1802409 RepID=A0A1F7VF54_9BACT|nr:MAG: GDP-mannose 4,6-dehydratase [Candidatus Uhrbacteria bacterium RIFCSPLOWO2_02_FULL_49_11]
MKKALITGITGQDGSYLAELLLEKGYEVHGIIRRSSSFNTERLNQIYQDPHEQGRKLFLHYGDLGDASSINRIIERTEPDEIYNLGAQSHVMVSFEIPEFTSDVDGLGALRLLDAIKDAKAHVKVYQAGSSEMFGKAQETPQKETTPFHPRSPYACAKTFAYHIAVNYREAYGLFVSNGILFNHTSPRRGGTFVTKKITNTLSKMKLGIAKPEVLYLGNLNAKRDWGYAPEYAEAMWLMLQQNTPDDYVIATGESHSVREFATRAAQLVGYNLKWQGEGPQEKGIDAKSGKVLVEIDPRYFRPSEVDTLLGDATKAREKLGWTPHTTFDELVRIMLDAEFREMGKNPKEFL